MGGGAHWVTYRNRIQKSWMGAQNQDIWTQQKKRAGGRLTPGDIHKHEKKNSLRGLTLGEVYKKENKKQLGLAPGDIYKQEK